MTKIFNHKSGVTLIETLVAVAVFTLVGFAVYQAYSAILATFQASRIKLAAIDLANEEIEFLRNVPYESVGIEGGVPTGVLASSSIAERDGLNFVVNRYVRNIDDPFDGVLGGAPNDLAPADYKLVELQMFCPSCGKPGPYIVTARISPRGLETSSSNGALFIQAIDANGEPVSGATVQLSNTVLDPDISITDTTDSTGWLRIVDVPPSLQAYNIQLSKGGYSSDRTYAISIANPNPVRPDLTVALQQITQTTLAIDRVSQFNVSSVGETCEPLSQAIFSLKGNKMIGSNPVILKYDESHITNESGQKTISNLEWDTYSLTLTDPFYSLLGMTPLSPISLSPNVNQSVSLVLHTKAPRELLVTVKDTATFLPLSNAAVNLTGPGFTADKLTGVGFLKQTDWSGGGGQVDFDDQARFFEDDGNLDISTTPGVVTLFEVASSTYASTGILTSSTFDTGSPATFKTISWLPGSQPPETGPSSVELQLATTNDPATTTWNYLGPDGTSSTFYTTGTPDVSGIHTGDRYLRYRLYFSTASTTYTPMVSDVAFTFSADCVPSGQTYFDNLDAGNYTLTVTRAGYEPYSQDVSINTDWQEQEVLLSP